MANMCNIKTMTILKVLVLFLWNARPTMQGGTSQYQYYKPFEKNQFTFAQNGQSNRGPRERYLGPTLYEKIEKVSSSDVPNFKPGKFTSKVDPSGVPNFNPATFARKAQINDDFPNHGNMLMRMFENARYGGKNQFNAPPRLYRPVPNNNHDTVYHKPYSPFEVFRNAKTYQQLPRDMFEAKGEAQAYPNPSFSGRYPDYFKNRFPKMHYRNTDAGVPGPQSAQRRGSYNQGVKNEISPPRYTPPDRTYSRDDPCVTKYDGQFPLSGDFRTTFPYTDNMCYFVKCANKRAFLNPCGPGTRNDKSGNGFCSILDLEGYCGRTVYDKKPQAQNDDHATYAETVYKNYAM